MEVKGKTGKVSGFNGSSNEYLILIGSKNQRVKPSEISKINIKNKKPNKDHIIRKKQPVKKLSNI